MHLADHYYYIYNRGCNREDIFANPGNRLFLLQRAKSFLKDYPLRVIAYCLMPNHYHFLLRPEEDGCLSLFIQRLFNSYTQAFNKQQWHIVRKPSEKHPGRYRRVRASSLPLHPSQPAQGKTGDAPERMAL
jgi:REP element-mobilizing transposase RayT